MSKVNTKLTALIAPLSLAAGLAITTSASSAEYLADSQGENVRNNYDECWEVSYGLPTCGEELYTISGSGLFDFDKATIKPEGKVVLNVADTATENLRMDNEAVEFKARFSGKPYPIYIPMEAIIAIYARENGQGMMFAQDDAAVAGSDDDKPDDTPPSRSHLKVVK